eukprot:5676331-Amphidinium_carterae.2
MEVLAQGKVRIAETAGPPTKAEPNSLAEALQKASALGGQESGKAGGDESSTGAQASGIMASALGSLQETGFAARRATSRLLHMQSRDYLRTHEQNRRG